jgi:hypothetical protein
MASLYQPQAFTKPISLSCAPRKLAHTNSPRRRSDPRRVIQCLPPCRGLEAPIDCGTGVTPSASPSPGPLHFRARPRFHPLSSPLVPEKRVLNESCQKKLNGRSPRPDVQFHHVASFRLKVLDPDVKATRWIGNTNFGSAVEHDWDD